MPEKGDFVLVAFPFSDMTGEKRRPALVVGFSDEHAILLFITSRQTGRRPWRIPIAPTKQTGLHVASVIQCDKITSLDVRILTGKLGESPANVLKSVDANMRQLFQL